MEGLGDFIRLDNKNNPECRPEQQKEEFGITKHIKSVKGVIRGQMGGGTGAQNHQSSAFCMYRNHCS
ncbi:hypothetical protein XELAEV_18043493mg, partial [Xenopus laevis]